MPCKPILLEESWASDASLKEVLREALKIKESLDWYLKEIFGFTELSDSKSSYLNAPFNSNDSLGEYEASIKNAEVSLDLEDSSPPPRNNKLAGFVIFPSASNSAIEFKSLDKTYSSSLNWTPKARLIELICPVDKKSNTVIKVLNLFRKKKLIKNQAFKINIKKNIPHGSGLGGGSSNAAYLINYLKNIKNHLLK